MTLLFKIHYFLWYGAHTSIYGYESVYARHYTNASTVQFGTLRMVLPFIAVIVTPILCSNADRKRKHRLYFSLSLIMALLSLALYSFLPLSMSFEKLKITEPCQSTDCYERGSYSWFGKSFSSNYTKELKAKSPIWIGPWIIYCSISLIFELSLAVNTCLSDSFAVLQAEEDGTTFGRVIVWGTFGLAASALTLSAINQINYLPRLLPGLIFGTVLLSIDSMIVSLWTRDEDFKLDSMANEMARSLTWSSSSGHRRPSDYMPTGEESLMVVNCENDKISSVRQRHTGASSHLDKTCKLKKPNNIRDLEDLAATVRSTIGPDDENFNGPLAIATIKTIDSDQSQFTIDYLSDQSGSRSASVKQPAVGKISKIPITLKKFTNTSTAKIDPYSVEKSITNGIPMQKRVNLEVVDRFQKGVSTYKSQSKAAQQSKGQITLEHATLYMQLNLFCIILRRRKALIRFLTMFVLSGFFMSMHWNYFFLYLEKVHSSQFTLISALSMLAQSLLGELPFFIFSRKIIDVCGKSHTISLSIISIGLRFIIYRFLITGYTSVYWVFLADCLQGPNYGLFYVVMAEIGSEYSYCDDQIIEDLSKRESLSNIDFKNLHQIAAIRLALRSTVQSVAFACYEGLGVGLGGLVGGLLLSNQTFKTLWLSMSLLAFLVGLVNIILEVSTRACEDSTVKRTSNYSRSKSS